ncbi:MAG TPA: replicative helicase loader/inhibitor [Pseudogracilibacillus sp.]|nr:replicative helicase loader/inhibitor [Pseudogracilibacillus sp.]
MNRKQVFHVLKFLKDAYPNFHVDQSKIDHWTRILKDQNPATVMRHAERYVLDNKYPPCLSDLLELNHPSFSNGFLKLKKFWEREAVGHQPRS